jgi:ribosomal protein S18 acetylase RimI-like enzyme
MISLDQVIDYEINFPHAFASVMDKPYARLFYNTGNPQSHDSNHAVFLNLEGNLEQSLEDLILFYRVKSLIPRVYPSYCPREREQLLPYLAKRGFEIKYPDERLYFKDKPSRLIPQGNLIVERVRVMTEHVREIIRKDDGGDWNVIVIEKKLHSDRFHLLVGYAGGDPVCLAALHLMDGLVRLDDVITDKDYRGRGYGRALVQAALEYHQQLSARSGLYLWASNPTAIRIYREAGFVALEPGLEPWNAWYAPVGKGK